MFEGQLELSEAECQEMSRRIVSWREDSPQSGIVESVSVMQQDVHDV